MVAAIIQARNGSTRLPGKVMMTLAGRRVIEHVVERVQAAGRIRAIVVATTNEEADTTMAEFLSHRGIEVFRGSTHDVLDRYYQTALSRGFKHIVRITADCPLIDPKIIDQVVQEYQKKKVDYCANVLERTFPDGLDVEVFSFEALTRAWQQTQYPAEREHVTLYIRRHPEFFSLANVALNPSLGKERWTLDYPEDFDLIERVLQETSRNGHIASFREILQCLDDHPAWRELNERFCKY